MWPWTHFLSVFLYLHVSYPLTFLSPNFSPSCTHTTFFPVPQPCSFLAPTISLSCPHSCTFLSQTFPFLFPNHLIFCCHLWSFMVLNLSHSFPHSCTFLSPPFHLPILNLVQYLLVPIHLAFLSPDFSSSCPHSFTFLSQLLLFPLPNPLIFYCHSYTVPSCSQPILLPITIPLHFTYSISLLLLTIHLYIRY